MGGPFDPPPCQVRGLINNIHLHPIVGCSTAHLCPFRLLQLPLLAPRWQHLPRSDGELHPAAGLPHQLVGLGGTERGGRNSTNADHQLSLAESALGRQAARIHLAERSGTRVTPGGEKRN